MSSPKEDDVLCLCMYCCPVAFEALRDAYSKTQLNRFVISLASVRLFSKLNQSSRNWYEKVTAMQLRLDRLHVA